MTSMKFFLGSKENEEGVSDMSEDDEEGKQDDAKTVKEVGRYYFFCNNKNVK